MIITAGIYKGRKVIAPDEKIVRPTLSKAREGIFNVLFSLIDFEGKSFLDMFSGSGIMGLEAISRGFREIIGIEKNPSVIKIIKENYKRLGLEPNLVFGDSLKVLKKFNQKFDVIYIDPPYFSGIYEQSLKLIKEKELFNPSGIIILEHVIEINPQDFGFEKIKEKTYSNKKITFIKSTN